MVLCLKKCSGSLMGIMGSSFPGFQNPSAQHFRETRAEFAHFRGARIGEAVWSPTSFQRRFDNCVAVWILRAQITRHKKFKQISGNVMNFGAGCGRIAGRQLAGIPLISNTIPGNWPPTRFQRCCGTWINNNNEAPSDVFVDSSWSAVKEVSCCFPLECLIKFELSYRANWSSSSKPPFIVKTADVKILRSLELTLPFIPSITEEERQQAWRQKSSRRSISMGCTTKRRQEQEG